MKPESIVPIERIENCIHIIRGQRVMLDQDLAALYETPTKRLNEQVRRNIERFPDDFMFQLSAEELENWRSQIATSNPNAKMGLRRRPHAFTEHGALMLANILRSDRATQMSIEVIRAFIHLRRLLASHEALAKEAKEIKSFVLKYSHATDREFRRVWTAIEKLSAPQTREGSIGFQLN